MKKNKVDEDEETYWDDESTEETEEDLDEEFQDENSTASFNDDDTPADPMGLAAQISKESDTVKYFKDMPKETRFSFLDSIDKLEVKHHSRAYRNWKYIEKIITLRVEEDKIKRLSKKDLLQIRNKQGLKDYLKTINKDYLISVVDDLDDKDIEQIYKFLIKIKPNYLLDAIEERKNKMTELYTDYNKNIKVPSYVDDMDNLGKVVDTSIVSMGYKGNAASHSVMTIQAVKNEDVQKVAEEKSKFSLLDAIKRRFG